MITLQKGRYEALEPLGSGATSRVEKARDNVIGRTVALKTFINGFGEGQEQQFLREAQIIGQLSNPAIVQLYDVGIDEQGTPFLVMEYIAGKTLEHHLDPSQLPPQRACAWAADLAGALAIAHRAGILHGDVKPGNILVTPENKVKLGDFGIARFASQVSGSGRLMGTPAYLAPEQIEGRPQDSRSDQFALGIVLYQMLTGARPFDGSSVGAVCAQILNAAPMPPSQRNRAVTPALDRVVARCLARIPEAASLRATTWRQPFIPWRDLSRNLALLKSESVPGGRSRFGSMTCGSLHPLVCSWLCQFSFRAPSASGTPFLLLPRIRIFFRACRMKRIVTRRNLWRLRSPTPPTHLRRRPSKKLLRHGSIARRGLPQVVARNAVIRKTHLQCRLSWPFRRCRYSMNRRHKRL